MPIDIPFWLIVVAACVVYFALIGVTYSLLAHSQEKDSAVVGGIFWPVALPVAIGFVLTEKFKKRNQY